MRKKLDERIRTLIENGVKTRHRSMFVIIGDKSLDQIVNLHDVRSKLFVNSRPSALWCYKNKLEISSHKKKKARQIKKLISTGLLDPEKVDSFSLFLETAGIKYCRYKDSERILGNTFGMCILQDFEALTPNLLARTIETVEGGGLIILLLHSLSSLTSLYTMVMDVHERFRTESHSGPLSGRFNERFLLSLASCGSCVVIDDELNILPISSHIKSISPVPVQVDSNRDDLNDLKEQLKDDFPVGPLIKMCYTLDQGAAVIKFLHEILDKTLCSTVALLAGRGRGKSAALGLAIAGAVAAGYSNIFVTAPSPENLKTLFEFVSKGFDMLEYKEHLDYDIVKSSDPELNKVTIRMNIYKQHRQTIQYIQPHEHGKLSQVELLVVDEAAAIPLPVVKSLLGPYLVFLSSTVNGYEGTGRSLSLKLLQQLEDQSKASTDSKNSVSSCRPFKKLNLSEAIRYASGDPIESWLNNLLCLDIANSIPSINRLPTPSECDLYYVNRDTLFSYHKDSELFLQRMMALYVASHYKNSPNDLQLLADAKHHQLFVLLGPVNESRNQLPDILCVIQVCLEGQISKASAIESLSTGHQPFGDQIPWKFCEQFQDKDFQSLSGVRIVRIATHPDAMKLGYGSAAIELLTRYYEGEFASISEVDEVDVLNDAEAPRIRITEAAEKVSLHTETIKPRSDLPPLLVHLGERRPQKLHYMGVSFGLTLDLFRFWRKHKFAPFYICQVPNTVTGEHTCMMLKPLYTDDIEVNSSDEMGFVGPFYRAFRATFARLMCSPKFNTMEYKLAMSILDPKLSFTDVEPSSTISHGGIYDDIIKSPISMQRLEAYVNHLADHHLILDLTQPLAYLYFQEKLPVTLSYVQASVLLLMGLQNQDVSYAEGAMKLGRQQILALFMKVMKKFYKHFDSVSTKQFNASLPPAKQVYLRPHSISVDEDLDEAAKKVKDDLKEKSVGLLNPDFLQRYAISNMDVDFETALQNDSGKIPSGGLVSVKSSKTKTEKHGKPKEKSDNKRSKETSTKLSKKKRTS